MSHSPHRPRCCSQWGWEPLSCPNQTLRRWRAQDKKPPGPTLWHLAPIHRPSRSDLPPVLTRRTTGCLLHCRHFAEPGKREPWQGAVGVFPEGEVGWEEESNSEGEGTRMKSDGERAAGVGKAKPCHSRAASTELTQVVIVFLLALFCQSSALSICNQDPQRHPEGTTLHLAP